MTATSTALNAIRCGHKDAPLMRAQAHRDKLDSDGGVTVIVRGLFMFCACFETLISLVSKDQ